MVKLNKIYTRTGDDGSTGLVGGARRRKCDFRVEAYGAIDEANSAIGLARLELADYQEIDLALARIQNDLFDLGADLATPDHDIAGALRVAPSQVARLESEIDAFNGALAPLKSFVLPGGTRAAAQLHMARAICRRAERAMAALVFEGGERVGQSAMQYVNRLSDLLFVFARAANDQGAGDVLWVPGASR